MKRWMFDFLLLPLLACVLGYGVYQLVQPKAQPVPPRYQAKSYQGEPVALNLPAAGVTDGFRGDVHPLLHGQTKLELTAHWVADKSSQHGGKAMVVEGFAFYLDMQPVKQKQTYTERDFSAFLPEKLDSVGQIWSLDLKKVQQMMRQFSPGASTHLDAKGRRIGPDGAFALLRAVSPAYLDIAIRVHAEFDVTTDVLAKLPAGREPVEQAWYSPAYFIGQMIVNRDKGTVEYFRLGIPTDQTLNAQLTLKTFGPKPISHFLAKVDRMELIGGNSELAAKSNAWETSISSVQAYERLAKLFYRFLDIQWLPYDQILTAAREKNKPILLIVPWGAFDDQSC